MCCLNLQYNPYCFNDFNHALKDIKMLIQGLSSGPLVRMRFRVCLHAWRPQPRWRKCKRWKDKTLFTLRTFLQFYLVSAIIAHKTRCQIIQYLVPTTTRMERRYFKWEIYICYTNSFYNFFYQLLYFFTTKNLQVKSTMIDEIGNWTHVEVCWRWVCQFGEFSWNEMQTKFI